MIVMMRGEFLSCVGHLFLRGVVTQDFNGGKVVTGLAAVADVVRVVGIDNLRLNIHTALSRNLMKRGTLTQPTFKRQGVKLLSDEAKCSFH